MLGRSATSHQIKIQSGCFNAMQSVLLLPTTIAPPCAVANSTNEVHTPALLLVLPTILTSLDCWIVLPETSSVWTSSLSDCVVIRDMDSGALPHQLLNYLQRGNIMWNIQMAASVIGAKKNDGPFVYYDLSMAKLEKDLQDYFKNVD